MIRLSAALFTAFFLSQTALGAEPPLSRSEGFRILWESLKRPIEETSEKPFIDVPKEHADFALLRYAKARKFFPERETSFSPDEVLTLRAALVWLFRTRNIDDPDEISEDSLLHFITRYAIGISPDDLAENPPIPETDLITMMNILDDELKKEIHTVSFYAEEFAGDHTAFGEIFDPQALTAAHRTFPHNTIVKVTNHDNGTSVTVRINDRGPYVAGRSMDLSLAAFETLSTRSAGVLRNVSFERMGSGGIVSQCPRPSYQRRLGRTLLTPGIPRTATVGMKVSLTADTGFRMIQMRRPGMPPIRSKEWTHPGASFAIDFDKEGITTFILHEDGGTRRRMRTKVAGSC